MSVDPQPPTGKVFGLGLARTGTTSLHEAMGILGLRSAPDSLPLLDKADVDFLHSYDVFFDNPVPFRYRDLEAACENSRWIVTQRPLEEWLRSMRWLFGPGLDRLDSETRNIGDQVHRRLYGIDRFDSTVLSDIYQTHYAELEGWIQDRDFVWLHLDRDELNWDSLCDFLDLARPRQRFPRSNKRARGLLSRSLRKH